MATCSAEQERSCGLSSLAFHLEKGFPPQPRMTNHDAAPTDMGMPEEKSIHLSLPGLLPENHMLVLNTAKRIVILLSDEPEGGARSVKEQLFPPSGMRVLLPLLQAYPNYCPYEVLLAHLYPISVEEGRKQLQEAHETTMRPVRRAIGRYHGWSTRFWTEGVLNTKCRICTATLRVRKQPQEDDSCREKQVFPAAVHTVV